MINHRKLRQDIQLWVDVTAHGNVNCIINWEITKMPTWEYLNQKASQYTQITLPVFGRVHVVHSYLLLELCCVAVFCLCCFLFVFWFCLHPLSCVPNVACGSGLSVLDWFYVVGKKNNVCPSGKRNRSWFWLFLLDPLVNLLQKTFRLLNYLVFQSYMCAMVVEFVSWELRFFC